VALSIDTQGKDHKIQDIWIVR